MGDSVELKEKIKKLYIEKKNESMIGGVIIIALIVLVTSMYASPNSVYSVTVNNIEIGYIEDENLLKDAKETVQILKADEVGAEVFLKKNIIIATESEEKTETFLLKEDIGKLLLEDTYFETNAYIINIENNDVVALKTKEDAEQVLIEAQNVYLEDTGSVVEFEIKEKVDIVKEAVDLQMIYSVEDATRLVVTGTTEEKIYTVEKGDSNWKIARQFDISVEDINNANPGMDSDLLQIGQKINLITPIPYLTIAIEEEATYSEKISYGITYEKTDILYEGEEKVKKYGVFGVKEITAKIIKENNTEIERDIIGSSVVKDAENQVVLIGTKAIPSSLGTGNLDSPTRGVISSAYGSRWGTVHRGVDIANAVGTNIYAADGGVVTYAGWKGDYGYAIMISHGNGIITLYGHNSQLLVSKGDVVDKGDLISKMGATGNVTGPHVHFEVRVNGVRRDPAKYIEY